MGRVSKVLVFGPLEQYQRGFEAALAAAGYTPLSAALLVRLMSHVSVWLEERDLCAADLGPRVVGSFLDARRTAGYSAFLSPRGLVPLLGYLRAVGAAPAPVIETPAGRLDGLLDRYRSYLVAERGLVPATVSYYLRDARPFLAGWVDDGESRLNLLSASDVTGFVVDECARRAVGSAKILVTVLRSLLRFLFLEGLTGHDLSSAVPAVAGWRGSYLPKGITPAKVSALLAAREGSSAVARRDQAILLLLARLGLRRIEVARLQLDDIDWHRGEITVRGKDDRAERLPLPVDVGEAIVEYLRHARPVTAARAVFLDVRAPFAPVKAATVTAMVQRTSIRAGLEVLSPHRLRHTVATEMLRAETPLVEVGQVLRHRSLATTAIYAKVDRVALRGLAMPWPQVAAS